MDREESLKKIVSDYDEREKANVRREESQLREEAVKRSAAYATRIILFIVGLGAILFLGVRIMQGAGVFEKKKYWAAGKMLATDYRIEECVGRMWDIRKEIDAYYSRYRTFPASMEELYKGKAGSKPYTCPASGAPYVMKDRPGKRIFSCPNPADHNVSEIWCDVTSGPPAIERY